MTYRVTEVGLLPTCVERKRERAGQCLGLTEQPALRHPQQLGSDTQRCCRSIQGGHGRYRPLGQAGVCCEGQSEIREEGRAEAASQTTGKDREETRSGLITPQSNRNLIYAPSLSTLTGGQENHQPAGLRRCPEDNGFQICGK
jgi:hypothetical protein